MNGGLVDSPRGLLLLLLRRRRTLPLAFSQGRFLPAPVIGHFHPPYCFSVAFLKPADFCASLNDSGLGIKKKIIIFWLHKEAIQDRGGAASPVPKAALQPRLMTMMGCSVEPADVKPERSGESRCIYHSCQAGHAVTSRRRAACPDRRGRTAASLTPPPTPTPETSRGGRVGGRVG